jgi:hypothetical protein
MAETPAPLVLEDLPNDLLRHCLRAGSLAPRDLIAVRMLNRRLRALVNEGGALRELTIAIMHANEWDEAAGELVPFFGLYRRLLSSNTLQTDANQASLGWLADWPLLRGPLLMNVTLDIISVGDFEAEPALPETWARLRDLLSPTAAVLCCQPDPNPPYTLFWSLQGEAAVSWLVGCPRLHSLRVEVSGAEEIYGPEPQGLPIGNVCEALAPLTQLKELNFSPGYGFLQPGGFAPLAALSALTALTLPLAKWDVTEPELLPVGPLPSLPPALETLTLQLSPLSGGFVLEDLRGGDYPYYEQPDVPQRVDESLESAGLRDALAAAAPTLRRLDIILTTGEAAQVSKSRYEHSFAYALYLKLTPESLPCLLPGLEEFSFNLDDQDSGENHTAGLIALLEAAPGLRRVRLKGINSMSLMTMVWLAEHRPGFRLEGGQWDITLELPA